MNGYNFTERVRNVLSLARYESQRLHHEYVGTEHILLGLLREGEGVAAAVLKNLEVDLKEIAATIESVVKVGDRVRPMLVDLPYSTRAKKVLELAMEEARSLAHNYVGTEHLLLGLLREEKGISAQVLKQAGLTEQTVRAETLRVVGTSEPPTLTPSSVLAVTVHFDMKGGSTVRRHFGSIAEAIEFLKLRGGAED